MLTKTEWCWDFDGLVHEIEGMGSEGRFRLKGRCKRCWGGLIGKGHGDGIVPTAIRCRVCGLLLEGDKAREEFQRMSEQANVNTLNIAYNLPTKYRDDGKFVQKIFPYMARQSEDELCRRPNAEAQEIDHRDLLTRTSFPVGSAGFLVLQARAFMSGVEQLPWQLSVVPFSEVGMRDDPNAREKELMKRLGCTMNIAMNSAFSCELSMKAICLTRIGRHACPRSAARGRDGYGSVRDAAKNDEREEFAVLRPRAVPAVAAASDGGGFSGAAAGEANGRRYRPRSSPAGWGRSSSLLRPDMSGEVQAKQERAGPGSNRRDSSGYG